MIGLHKENSAKRASGRCASGDARIVDWAACHDVACSAGRASGCERTGRGGIDVLCKRQVVAHGADVSRGHAEIRCDLPLDGEIELIAIRPLEILREAEERPSRSEKLRRNEWKRINAAYAAATPGATRHRRTKRRAGGIFRH